MTEHKSQEIAELLAALSLAQGELNNVEKDSENPFFKSGYASLAACLNVVRPVLAKHGLSYQQTVSSGEAGQVCVTSVLGHKSGQWWASDLCLGINHNAQNAAQETGKVITYLRRYMLTAQLGIAQEDDDGNAGKLVSKTPVAHQTTLTEKEQGNIQELANVAGVDIQKICGRYDADDLSQIKGNQYRSIMNSLKKTIENEKGNDNG